MKGSGLQCRTAETGPELSFCTQDSVSSCFVFPVCSPLTKLWDGSKQETQSKKTHYLVVRMHRTEENTAGTRGIKLNTHSTGGYHNKAGINHWDTDQDIQTETDDKQRVKTEGIEWPKWKHDNHRDRTDTGIWMGKEIKEHYITNRGYNKRYKGQSQP